MLNLVAAQSDAARSLVHSSGGCQLLIAAMRSSIAGHDAECMFDLLACSAAAMRTLSQHEVCSAALMSAGVFELTVTVMRRALGAQSGAHRTQLAAAALEVQEDVLRGREHFAVRARRAGVGAAAEEWKQRGEPCFHLAQLADAVSGLCGQDAGASSGEACARVRRAEAEKVAGNAAFSGGDWAAAEAAYGRALTHAPRMTALLTNRAAARLKLENWGGAEADAAAALQQEPGNVKALMRRGQARRQLGRAAEAAADLRAALALAPADDAILTELRAAEAAAPPSAPVPVRDAIAVAAREVGIDPFASLGPLARIWLHHGSTAVPPQFCCSSTVLLLQFHRASAPRGSGPPPACMQPMQPALFRFSPPPDLQHRPSARPCFISHPLGIHK